MIHVGLGFGAANPGTISLTFVYGMHVYAKCINSYNWRQRSSAKSPSAAL